MNIDYTWDVRLDKCIDNIKMCIDMHLVLGDAPLYNTGLEDFCVYNIGEVYHLKCIPIIKDINTNLKYY